MEQLIAQLTEKVGIDEDMAGRIAEFIRDHLDDLPKWLGSGVMDSLPGGLGDMVQSLTGGDQQPQAE